MLQVLDVPIRVLATTETAVVVCKPASMPVHPTGQYRKNSVLGILASQVRYAVPNVSLHHTAMRWWLSDDAMRRLGVNVQHRMSLGRLCPVHRLDRNVSGLLLFATGPAAANQLRLQIQARVPAGVWPVW